MVEILNISQSNVSHHLKILGQLGFIEYQRNGNQKFYNSLNEKLPEKIKYLWDDLDNLVKELPEANKDDINLLKVLDFRQNQDANSVFNSWRILQPDLPYTYEFALSGIKKYGSAIDIGCGNGEFINILKDSYETVVGIDVSFLHLKKAKSFITSTGNLIQADSAKLPFAHKSFNSAYLRMTLRFLRDPDKSLKEIISALKPGGSLNIIDLNSTGKESPKIDYNLNYFKNFCKKVKNISICSYKKYENIFICNLIVKE